MTVFAGLAEFEHDLIRERIGTGRADAQKRGIRFGRLKKMNDDQRKMAQRLLKEGKRSGRSPELSASIPLRSIA